MTGIERLRELIKDYRSGHECEGIECGELSCGECIAKNVLEPIATQIEREHAEDCYRMVLDHGTVSRVASEMERHVLGVEGMEDSPVARWARELREALGGRDEEVTDVAAIRKDAMEAYEWVEAHDGLDAVKRRWECLSYYVDPVPRACMERRLASRQRQIDESHAALRRKNERIAELEHERDELREMVRSLNALTDEMEKRLMPEGTEWPRFESGEPVRIGDEVVCDGRCSPAAVDFIELNGSGFKLYSKSGHLIAGADLLYGKRVKRPAPKVLDADGAEIELGDDLYSVEGGLKFHVSHIDRINGKIATDAMFALDKWADPKMYTHRAPVLAADGKPLREGETVLVTMDEPHDAPLSRGDEVTVRFVLQSTIVHVEDEEGSLWYVGPNDLTHERPVNHCFECSHWQVEPGRDRLGVCWDTYGELECEDSYAAVLGTSEACAQFERRAKALAGGA